MSKPDDSQIRLRVAGIFYDRVFSASSIPKGSNGIMTIENVMDFARLTSPLDYGFEYRAAALNLDGAKSVKSMIQIAHRIDESFNSLGGKTRPQGIYRLLETAIPAGVVAWQYYIARVGGSPSTNPEKEIVSPALQPPKQKFTPYDRMPVQAGDTIIWRMVAICTNPAPKLVDHA